MSIELLNQLAQTLIDGDPDATEALTRQALEAGLEPLTIIQQALVPGMNKVGEYFQCGDFYLPDLMIAADGMQKAMELLEPELRSRQQALAAAGTVVIGTVRGDIHEIGKSLVATMLSANGFKVYDLGVDVPTETFVAKIQETGANLLGLSALLTTTMTVQREVIQALETAGLRQGVKVMLGGAPVTRSWVEEAGADGYAEDAMSAVTLAQQLVKG